MNKEIEEMAQVIFDYVDSKQMTRVFIVNHANELAKPFVHNTGVAKALYNAGYRKIDENCAVITKAELKEYKRQAVKEFAERVKNAFYAEFDEIIPSIMANKIDELLKEYEK